MDTTCWNYNIFYSAFIFSLLISKMGAQNAKEDKEKNYCTYTFTTSIGELLVNDGEPGVTREGADIFCKNRSGVLAPIKTRNVYDEINELLTPCYDKENHLHYRTAFLVGLIAKDGMGFWTDGTLYDADLHDSVTKNHEPNGYKTGVDVCKSFEWNLVCCVYYFIKMDTSDTGLISAGPCHDLASVDNMPFLCILPHKDYLTGSYLNSILFYLLLIIPITVLLLMFYMERQWIQRKLIGASDE